MRYTTVDCVQAEFMCFIQSLKVGSIKNASPTDQPESDHGRAIYELEHGFRMTQEVFTGADHVVFNEHLPGPPKALRGDEWIPRITSKEPFFFIRHLVASLPDSRISVLVLKSRYGRMLCYLQAHTTPSKPRCQADVNGLCK